MSAPTVHTHRYEVRRLRSRFVPCEVYDTTCFAQVREDWWEYVDDQHQWETDHETWELRYGDLVGGRYLCDEHAAGEKAR